MYKVKHPLMSKYRTWSNLRSKHDQWFPALRKKKNERNCAFFFVFLHFLPIANGIINNPTRMSLTARLTIRIFDAVCNFRTRHTLIITTKLPKIVKIHMIEQTRIINAKCAGLRRKVMLNRLLDNVALWLSVWSKSIVDWKSECVVVANG